MSGQHETVSSSPGIEDEYEVIEEEKAYPAPNHKPAPRPDPPLPPKHFRPIRPGFPIPNPVHRDKDEL